MQPEEIQEFSALKLLILLIILTAHVFTMTSKRLQQIEERWETLPTNTTASNQTHNLLPGQIWVGWGRQEKQSIFISILMSVLMEANGLQRTESQVVFCAEPREMRLPLSWCLIFFTVIHDLILFVSKEPLFFS